MKNLKIAFVAAALMVGAVGAFATKSNLADKKYRIINQGGSGSSAYWVVSTDVTGQIPEAPGAYRCDENVADNCTATSDQANFFTASGQLRVLKSNVTVLEAGQFIDL